MIGKDRLLKIEGLMLSGRIDKRSGAQLDEYCEALEGFTDEFSRRETHLKECFSAKDYEAFSNSLSGLKDLLTKIYADKLAQGCLEMISDINKEEHEKTEAKLTSLLSSIAILSIDIQMARYKKAEVESAAAGEKDGHEYCILGVDDVPLFLNGLKMVLQELPCKFIGVTSGDAALKYTSTHTPDLFIFDLEMPGMNGYELAEKVRENGQKAPIIFLTGNSSKEYVIKAIRAGAADFIIKPIDKTHVLNVIGRYIRF